MLVVCYGLCRNISNEIEIIFLILGIVMTLEDDGALGVRFYDGLEVS